MPSLPVPEMSHVVYALEEYYSNILSYPYRYKHERDLLKCVKKDNKCISDDPTLIKILDSYDNLIEYPSRNICNGNIKEYKGGVWWRRVEYFDKYGNDSFPCDLVTFEGDDALQNVNITYQQQLTRYNYGRRIGIIDQRLSILLEIFKEYNIPCPTLQTLYKDENKLFKSYTLVFNLTNDRYGHDSLMKSENTSWDDALVFLHKVMKHILSGKEITVDCHHLYNEGITAEQFLYLIKKYKYDRNFKKLSDEVKYGLDILWDLKKDGEYDPENPITRETLQSIFMSHYRRKTLDRITDFIGIDNISSFLITDIITSRSDKLILKYIEDKHNLKFKRLEDAFEYLQKDSYIKVKPIEHRYLRVNHRCPPGRLFVSNKYIYDSIKEMYVHRIIPTFINNTKF